MWTISQLVPQGCPTKGDMVTEEGMGAAVVDMVIVVAVTDMVVVVVDATEETEEETTRSGQEDLTPGGMRAETIDMQVAIKALAAPKKPDSGDVVAVVAGASVVVVVVIATVVVVADAMVVAVIVMVVAATVTVEVAGATVAMTDMVAVVVGMTTDQPTFDLEAVSKFHRESNQKKQNPRKKRKKTKNQWSTK